MKAHFVTFYSPGTIVAEQTTKPIENWDVEKAKEMAQNIKERHAATPYGFRFITKARKDDELDSKIVDKSNMYYLGGEIITLEDLKIENNPDNRILISNMEINGWDKIVKNSNSWSWTQPLRDGDVVLNNN